VSDLREHGQKTSWGDRDPYPGMDARWDKTRLARNRRRAERAEIEAQLDDQLYEYESEDVEAWCEACGGPCDGLGAFFAEPAP
jgi:hypothetical protein